MAKKKEKVQKPEAVESTPMPTLVTAKNITAQKIPFHYIDSKGKLQYKTFLARQSLQLKRTPEVLAALGKFKDSLFIV